MPHKGWRAYAIDDFGDSRIDCEMCGNREVRWVHYMTHPNYPQDLKVGCVCAENMQDNYDGKQAEKVAKRKSNWFKKWTTDCCDGVLYHHKALRGDIVKVFECNNLFYWLVERKNTDEYHGVNIGGCKTELQAKSDVWQMYEDEGWL